MYLVKISTIKNPEVKFLYDMESKILIIKNERIKPLAGRSTLN